MKLNQLLKDDNAVSPVIGVILMVAITVILAAVIGTFVLGLGDQVQTTTPSASFGFDYTDATTGSNPDQLTIAHESGDTIDATKVTIVVAGATAEDSGGNSYDAKTVSANSWQDIATGSPSNIEAGSSITVSDSLFHQSGTPANTLPGDYAGSSGNNEHVVLDSATIRVVWTSASGDSSGTIGEWTGPDA